MSIRALFLDEDDARAVASRLSSDGFSAEVVRAGFAGEDDDEDQPWSVSTDAPDAVVEILSEAYDGWVDHDEPPGDRSRPPLPLPDAPMRRTGRSGD